MSTPETGGSLVTEEDGTMNWIYGARVAMPKWQNPEIQVIMADSVYSMWESTAVEAGYVPVDGTLVETIIPLWQHNDGSVDDQANEGADPDQISFQVSGQVNPAPPAEPAPEPTP